MKSLNQLDAKLEARTPISGAPFPINASGSYYLTGPLTVTTGNAITINASQVTLDLNGYTISSTAASANGTGITLLSGVGDVSILNGHIKGGVTYSGGTYAGPGFANGIQVAGAPSYNIRVAGITVSGCLGNGIFLSGPSSLADSCMVSLVGGYGLSATSVSHSVVYQCGLGAIIAVTASDSYGLSTGSGDGISATSAINCYGESSSGSGIQATNVANCVGQTVPPTTILRLAPGE